ncbi:11534_t:CDS:2 [Funneliformis geosporum]|uniref:Elongin-A n=1 Tax=Funneliformis geosporum TaxID=1117311 RepID=A0A9W4WXJ5_9GLOM|nr:18251_t:CDS:2 [Funneliformis geosporum]CAI2194144.1 11534_t:CDS:2 [Funneliformis geosporum]
MREHEEKSKRVVQKFLENLNNRSKNKRPISTSQSNEDLVSSRPTTSIQSAGTTSTSQIVAPVVQSNKEFINSTTIPTSFQSSRTITTQKTKLSRNTKNRTLQSQSSAKASVPDLNRPTDVSSLTIEMYTMAHSHIQYAKNKEPLKFYKTKDMREHEEKSKKAVQTFWENLNNRKKSSQINENTNASQPSFKVSSEVLDSSVSQTSSIQSKLKETSIRSTEQVNRVVTSWKGKPVDRSHKDTFLSLESTNKIQTQSFRRANENVVTTVAFTGYDQPLTKVLNKRKYSEDGEINNDKSIKFIVPTTRIQREPSMKVNLPNMPVPRMNNNNHMQSIVTLGSKNSGVKSLVQLCTMTLVSNKHRLYHLGNTPYHLLESILKFCTDEELRQLEEVNPRLVDEDMELWKRFLQQKLPGRPLPTNPKNYRNIYLDIIDEEKEKKERIIGKLKKAMAEEKAKKEARQVKMLSVAPREPKRKTSGYQKLTPLQKIRKEMIREGYIIFPQKPTHNAVDGNSKNHRYSPYLSFCNQEKK